MKTSFDKYLRESHELDPYGEENWYDDENELYIGDKVLCIKTTFNIPNVLNIREKAVKDKIYTIKRFNHFTKKIIYLTNLEGGFDVKNFKKIINENIHFHNDIDPYGEENWEENIIFNPGDEVICINSSLISIIFDNLEVGKKYIIDHSNTFDSDIIYLVGMDGFYSPSNFKKVINEHIHYLIDDDDEEYWKEYLKEKVDLIGLPSGTYHQITREQLKEVEKYISWSQRLNCYVYRDKDENKILMTIDPDSLF